MCRMHAVYMSSCWQFVRYKKSRHAANMKAGMYKGKVVYAGSMIYR
jgi:hypothetical protein